MKPLLAIRADADASIGVGHVMRCLALAQAWKDRGGEVVFLCASIPDPIRQRLSIEGFPCIEIFATPGSDEDALQTWRELSQYGARLLVVDGVRFRHRWQREVKQPGLSVLLLEDNGTSPPYCADWVWNADLPARPEIYETCEPRAKLLLGPDFVLLRREFLRVHPKIKIGTAVRNILITMGGSDPENFSERTLHALHGARKNGFKLRVVVGPANPHLKKLKTVAANMADLFPATSDMAEHMAWADLALTVEGGTLWELLYMGAPVVCWSRTDPISLLLAELSKGGAVVALPAGASPEDVTVLLEQLITDNDRLEAMRQRSRTIVDGRGAERVVDMLLTGLSN